MPMSPRDLQKLVQCLAVAALLAGTGGLPAAPADDWHLIVADMRNAGCFKPPVASDLDARRSESALCRFQAVRLVGLRGERAAIPELKALQANDPDPGVRSQAAVELV